MWNLSFKPENSEKWLNSGNIYINKKNDERLDIVLDPENLPQPGQDGKIRITAFPKKQNEPRKPDQQAYQTQHRRNDFEDDIPF